MNFPDLPVDEALMALATGPCGRLRGPSGRACVDKTKDRQIQNAAAARPKAVAPSLNVWHAQIPRRQLPPTSSAIDLHIETAKDISQVCGWLSEPAQSADLST